MKKIAALLLIASLCRVTGSAQTLQQIESKRILLPNKWGITTVGKTLPLGDLPLNICISPDKKLMAVTNNGQSTQSIQLIDVAKQTILDTKEVGKAWYGLAFSDDSRRLFASGGNDNWIMSFAIENNKLIARDTVVLGKPWPEKISVAGVALDDNRHTLYAVTKENNKLYIVDLARKQVTKEITLGGEGYACILSADKKTLYVSCWGCNKIEVFDTEKQQLKGNIAVGDHPNDMILNKAGTLLYVANSNDNTVSVVELKEGRVIETLNAALYPNSPSGSTTNSVALSDDDKTLYIANADNNCLAVYDVSVLGNSKSKGFVPTGWYPTCVRVVGKNIFVSNGKGLNSMANPKGPNPYKKKEKVIYQGAEVKKADEVQYIGGLFKGALSIIPVPTEEVLLNYTKAVYHNTPYKKENELLADGVEGNPIPRRVGAASAIKHVFYIVKENRTYDQVLGDMKNGNGDTSLVLFGEKVTPNQHALANEFVLFDNFYVDGEVSADGHNWSMAAYATDYLEKTWPTSYGGRGGSYDSEGNRAIASAKHGFIWDLCKKYGVSYRTYGEFADDYKPNIPVLENHYCPYYTSWDQEVMDTTRYKQWAKEFDSLVGVNSVPQFQTLRFINDHTEGLRLNRPSPIAHVADNDLATGLFIEHLSKSPIWNESVVFILEDDAQNGPDHVDAHRSPVFVAGGMVKRHFIDHTVYSTASVLRTIELILGLPPMSQYDAAAEPMWRCFRDSVDLAPFTAIGAKVDIHEKNVAMNEWQRKSDEFDFTKEDRAPDLALNEIIWKAVKGYDIPAPGPTRAAFIVGGADDDDD